MKKFLGTLSGIAGVIISINLLAGIVNPSTVYSAYEKEAVYATQTYASTAAQTANKSTENTVASKTASTTKTTSATATTKKYVGIVKVERAFARPAASVNNMPDKEYKKGAEIYFDKFVDGFAEVKVNGETYYVHANSLEIYTEVNGKRTLNKSCNALKNEATNKSLAKQIVSKYTNSSMTDIQKITAINNYLCNVITYDLDYFTVKDAVCNGKARCQGYANSFKVCMDELGIPCDIIRGQSKETGEWHAWNRVVINNTYYYVDVTWNDKQNNPNRYLLASKAEMEKDHVFMGIYDYINE